MMKFLLALIMLASLTDVRAQDADFLIVKKRNGRTERLYTVGTQISFQTTEFRSVDGTIVRLANDSVTVKNYVVQLMMDYLGLVHNDTISSFLTINHYKDITIVQLYDRTHRRPNYWVRKAQSLLLVAGAGYTILNLANGAYLNEPIGSKKNIRNISISVGAIGAGLLLGATTHPSKLTSSPRKHRIIYVNNSRPASS